MNKKYTSISIAISIWFFTSLVLISGWVVWFVLQGRGIEAATGVLFGAIGAIITTPVIIVLAIVLPIIKKSNLNKLVALAATCLGISFLYALLVADSFSNTDPYCCTLYTILLFACSFIAILICHKAIDQYFFTGTRNALYENGNRIQDSVTQINTNMETFNEQQHNDILLGTAQPPLASSSNKTLIKAITTAVLILAMMIPATFVSNLVMERQANQTAALNRIAASGSTQQSDKNFALLHTHDNNIKTMRATKYAILVIGLTFALFFIIELVQKNPMHPVQYILVGLGLVIFYTLLLSISEFIQFDTAYLIAALATLTLIVLYVKSHFKNWQAAGALAGVLTGLYAFIFVIISLEDAALLVGSIGLFIVLAVIMYTTRNINWYNPSLVGESRK